MCVTMNGKKVFFVKIAILLCTAWLRIRYFLVWIWLKLIQKKKIYSLACSLCYANIVYAIVCNYVDISSICVKWYDKNLYLYII